MGNQPSSSSDREKNAEHGANANAPSHAQVAQGEMEYELIELDFQLASPASRRRRRDKAVDVPWPMRSAGTPSQPPVRPLPSLTPSEQPLDDSRPTASTSGRSGAAHVCMAITASSWRGLRSGLRFLRAPASYCVTAGLCAFLPRVSKLMVRTWGCTLNLNWMHACKPMQAMR